MATRMAMVMVTDIPATDMVTMGMGTATAMDMATEIAAKTAPLPGREWLSYSADSPAPAIIADQSMESWGLRRGEQFGPTRRTMVTQTQDEPFPLH